MYTKGYFFSQCVILVHVVLIFNWHSVLGCTSSEPAEFRVLRKTDSGGKQVVVAVDENAKLYCRTNVPWKKCIWKPPRNGVRQVSSLLNCLTILNRTFLGLNKTRYLGII